WLEVKFLDRTIKRVKCIKPTVCATTTPTATPTVTPTTPPVTTPPVTATTTPAVVPIVNGNLAVTGTSGGNPVPWIAGSGLLLVFVGAGMLYLTWRNRRDSVPTLVEGDEDRPNDTVTFYPQH
ncbi:MAG: hypothetical protein EHM35_18510, partial [Planctomycetaceae bacterium]